MPELPGDPEVTKIFGFPGLEAIIRVTMKYVNILLVNQGMPELTYEQFRAEIETKMVDINNGTP